MASHREGTPWMRNSDMDVRHNNRFPRESILVRCLNCGDVSNGPLYHCRECYDNLCLPCVDAHRRVRITKDHDIYRIDSNASSVNTSSSSLLSFNSSDILNEIGATLNRIKNTSQASLTMWTSSKENRQNIASELGRSFLDGSDSTTEKPCVRNSLESAEASVAIVRYEMNTGEAEIRQLMQMYLKQVDKRENELLNGLTASVAVRKTALEREMNTYRTIQSSYEHCMRILDFVLQKGRPHQILRAKEICDLEIQHARDMQEFAFFPKEEIIYVPPGGMVVDSIRQIGKIAIEGSKIPEVVPTESQLISPSNPTQSIITTTEAKSSKVSGDSVNQISKVGDENSSKTKMNVWAQPIKFTGEKAVRTIIPRPSNPDGRGNAADKFDYKSAGQPTIIIGQGGSQDGEMSRPWGVCCTDEGNIVVADRSNNRILMFNPEGKFIRKFGKPGKEGPGCLYRPAGVAVDPRGRIFVTDKDNHRIQVFTQHGTFVFMFGTEGNQNGQFNYPWDIAINSVGEVAVTDTRNQRVQLFSNDGTFLRKFGVENVFYQINNLDSPRGICFNTKGNLIVTDFNNHRLLVIESDFKKAKVLGGPGSGPKQFLRPQGIAVDNKGKIAIADSRNNRVQIINEDGTYVWQFGSSGSKPGQFDRPCGVSFMPDGRVVVVDFGNNRVQVF